MLTYLASLWKSRGRMGLVSAPVATSPRSQSASGLYLDIQPMRGFKWQEARQTILHPYQAPYQLAFAMQNIPISELIEIDETYGSHIQERVAVMAEHPSLVLGTSDNMNGCVEEMYSWLTSHYLPRRFPTMFELQRPRFFGSSATHIKNLTDGEVYPLQPPQDPTVALRILGSLVDEDLLFMMPSPDGDGYELAAFVNCFANGPSTQKRLGMKLRDIHGPVPGYKDHLLTRMDQWFEKLQVGKVVKRSNWTITNDGRMFCPDGQTSFSELDQATTNDDVAKELYVRSERQTLRRLEKSGAIVFSLHTYLYPLKDIKAAGYGEDLIAAIDGLAGGNAPGMVGYKKSDIWGEAVKAYMRV